MKDPKITTEDLHEIANQIIEGFISGILDDEDGNRVSWEIKITKFKNN